MSGKVTGWVLEHGPHPDHTDRHGVAYGARARGLRAVLVTVADAANADGENAHPGADNVVRGSLYGRRQAGKILAELVEEGWLEVITQGGGRGNATVYRVPMVERGTECTESQGPNRALLAEELRTLDEESAHSATETAHPWSARQRVTNDPSNGDTQREGVALVGDADNEFERFWQQYPRRDGKRLYRAEALAIWRRLPPAERDRAMRNVGHYAAAAAAGTRPKDCLRWLRPLPGGTVPVFHEWDEPAVPDPVGRPSRQQRNLAMLRERVQQRPASDARAIGDGR